MEVVKEVVKYSTETDVEPGRTGYVSIGIQIGGTANGNYDDGNDHTNNKQHNVNNLSIYFMEMTD